MVWKSSIKIFCCQAVVTWAFILITVDLCEFEARLVYRASSRTASKVTQRNPILKNKNKTNKIFGY